MFELKVNCSRLFRVPKIAIFLIIKNIRDVFQKKLIKIFEIFSKFNKMSLRNETQANSKTTLGRYRLGPNQTLGFV